MTPNLYDDNQVEQVLKDRIEQKMQSQSWYQKFSNTATSIGTLVATLLFIVISAGVEIPSEYMVYVLVAIQVLGVLGIRITPNGVTKSTEAALLGGKHRG